MSCSRTQHGDACGDRTQDLSIRSPTPQSTTTPPRSLKEKAEMEHIVTCIISIQYILRGKGLVSNFDRPNYYIIPCCLPYIQPIIKFAKAVSFLF